MKVDFHMVDFNRIQNCTYFMALSLRCVTILYFLIPPYCISSLPLCEILQYYRHDSILFFFFDKDFVSLRLQIHLIHKTTMVCIIMLNIYTLTLHVVQIYVLRMYSSPLASHSSVDIKRKDVLFCSSTHTFLLPVPLLASTSKAFLSL